MDFYGIKLNRYFTRTTPERKLAFFQGVLILRAYFQKSKPFCKFSDDDSSSGSLGAWILVYMRVDYNLSLIFRDGNRCQESAGDCPGVPKMSGYAYALNRPAQ